MANDNEKWTLLAENKKKLKNSIFFIKATSFEQLSLWKEFGKEVSWEEDTLGLYEQIGTIGRDKKKPVCLSFTFAKIYGKQICFYTTTSRYNDSELVDEFIEKNYPGSYDKRKKRTMTDAYNFHYAIDFCKNAH